MNTLQKAAEALKQRAAQQQQAPPNPHLRQQGPFTVIGGNVKPITPGQTSYWDLNVKPIAEEIKRLRTASQLTQRQLAKKARCSQGTITRAENGLDISLFMLIKIIGALGKKITII